MFEVTARMKIRTGRLEGFKQKAAEIMQLTRERDTKTLRYDWFLNADETECEVREAYVDADGLLEHHFNIEGPKFELFHDYADDHDMTFYGEPSPALAELVDRMAGHVQVHIYGPLDQRVPA
jgi:quinol monooxygenase YgiN